MSKIFQIVFRPSGYYENKIHKTLSLKMLKGNGKELTK